MSDKSRREFLRQSAVARDRWWRAPLLRDGRRITGLLAESARPQHPANLSFLMLEHSA